MMDRHPWVVGMEIAECDAFTRQWRRMRIDRVTPKQFFCGTRRFWRHNGCEVGRETLPVHPMTDAEREEVDRQWYTKAIHNLLHRQSNPPTLDQLKRIYAILTTLR